MIFVDNLTFQNGRVRIVESLDKKNFRFAIDIGSSETATFTWQKPYHLV